MFNMRNNMPGILLEFTYILLFHIRIEISRVVEYTPKG